MAITLKQLYDLTVDLGMEADVRGMKTLHELLKDKRKEYNDLSSRKKEVFDRERLTNPYSDTRILFGKPDTKVKTLMVGIDIDTSELLLAHQMREDGTSIDAVMAHHPDGIALAHLDRVMELQEHIMVSYGVPVNVMEKILDKRISELARGLHPINHQKSVDAARYLSMPYLATHTVADNMVHRFLFDLVELHKKKLTRIGDIMDLFHDIPEFHTGLINGSGPFISVGSPKSKAGRIAVTDITGGTSGSKEQYERLAQAGIGTIIAMHMKEDYRQEAEKHRLNVIVTGHMPSDSIGMNLLVDHIEAQGVKIIPSAGYIRVRRPAKKNRR